MKKKIKNIKNEEFEYDVQNATGGGVSVLEPEYIITPDGEFISVPNEVDHNVVFSDYFNKYLDNKIPVLHESTEAALALSKINHVVYYGIRLNDLGNIYNNGGNSRGLGLLILPVNYKEMMSYEQKEAVKILLATNKSIFGNKEKIKVEIHESFNEKELNIEEFNLFLEDKEEENKRKN